MDCQSLRTNDDIITWILQDVIAINRNGYRKKYFWNNQRVIFPWLVCLVFFSMFTRDLKYLGNSSSPSLLFLDGNRNVFFLFFFFPLSISRLRNNLFCRWFFFITCSTDPGVSYNCCVHWFVPLSVPAQETWMCAWGSACAWRSRTSCGKGRNMLLLPWKRFLIWRRIWKSMRQANSVPGGNCSRQTSAWLTNSSNK